MRGKILCWIGIHHWDFGCVVDMGWVTDYAWCLRPDCRYEKPMPVNREPART